MINDWAADDYVQPLRRSRPVICLYPVRRPRRRGDLAVTPLSGRGGPAVRVCRRRTLAPRNEEADDRPSRAD